MLYFLLDQDIDQAQNRFVMFFLFQVIYYSSIALRRRHNAANSLVTIKAI
jgi:hypothetical protein